MNILLTGGTGFVGRALCHYWQTRGHKLWVYSRRPETVQRLCGDGVEPIVALDPMIFREPIDAVVNLAGEPIADARWSESRKQRIWSSRVDLTRELSAMISRMNPLPSVLLSASAIGYYGDQGDATVTEHTTPFNEFQHLLCEAWEAQAQEAEKAGVRVCRVRIGLVVGAGGGFLARMLLPFKMGLGGQLGSGDQWMSWVHRDDLVHIFDHLLVSSQFSGAFNATAPNPVTNQQFTRVLGKTLSRPTPFRVPAPVLKLALGEMSRLLLTGQKVMPSRLLDSGFNFRHPTLDTALEDVVQNP